jgi:hypothetical protein
LDTVRFGDPVMTNLDVWGINSYRGSNAIPNTKPASAFTDLFTTYAPLSGKPLVITEWGPPASTRQSGQPVELPNKAQGTADYIAYHWNGGSDSIIQNKDIVSGGVVFMWTDDWSKMPKSVGGEPFTHDPSTGTNDNCPGGWWDEEWFGIFSVAVDGRNPKDPNPGKPDILTPRAAFTTLQQLWTSN